MYKYCFYDKYSLEYKAIFPTLSDILAALFLSINLQSCNLFLLLNLFDCREKFKAGQGNL